MSFFVLPPAALMLYALVFKLLSKGARPKLRPTSEPLSSFYSMNTSDIPFPFDLFFGDRPLPYSKIYFDKALLSVFFGAALLLLELKYDSKYRIFNALAHCAFGVSSYFLWQLLPCCDKFDGIVSFL